jgi:hypothetical protein
MVPRDSLRLSVAFNYFFQVPVSQLNHLTATSNEYISVDFGLSLTFVSLGLVAPPNKHLRALEDDARERYVPRYLPFTHSTTS